MNPKLKRDFYRKCKEDIDWYLTNNNKEEYALLYRLLGDQASSKFVNFEGEMAEELLRELRIYFANKMGDKSPVPEGPSSKCPPKPGSSPGKPLIQSDTFIHEQNTASDTWEICHKLGKYPSVTVVDSAGNEVTTDVQYIDKNNCIVTTNGKFKGIAYLN